MLPVCYSCSLCNTHLFSLLLRRQLRSTLFPYTTLFRSQLVQADLIAYQKPLYQVLALPEDSKVPAPTLPRSGQTQSRSEEHTSELQSHSDLVCRLLLEKKNKTHTHTIQIIHTPRTCRQN